MRSYFSYGRGLPGMNKGQEELATDSSRSPLIDAIRGITGRRAAACPKL